MIVMVVMMMTTMMEVYFNVIYLIPFPSSPLADVVGIWLDAVGLIVFSKRGRSPFYNAILSARIFNLTVKFALSTRYSSRSAVYLSQVTVTDVDVFGFLVL